MIAYYRGKVMVLVDPKATPGGMAAIGLGADDVESFLRPGVRVGCENSPKSVTLTGDKAVLEQVMENIKTAQPDTLVRALQVDRAYHSHHMSLVAQHYLELMEKKVCPQDPKKPFYSSVHGRVLSTGKELGPTYWVENLVSPVRFSGAIADIVGSISGPKTFFEIGPHSALAGPIRQTLQSLKSSDDYINVLTRGKDSHAELLRAVGELWLGRHDLHLQKIVGTGSFLTDLPLYPWHYEEPLWFESRLAREYRLREFPHHDILGSRILESTAQSPAWRNMIRLESVPWIKEHEVAGDVVLPGVAFVTMAGEAIRQLAGTTDFTAKQIHIKAPLVLTEESASEVITQLHRVQLTDSLDSDFYDWSVSSYQNGQWLKHAFGQVRAGPGRVRHAPEISLLPRRLSAKAWYRQMRSLGLEYGTRFRGLEDLTAHPVSPRVTASLTHKTHEGESLYAIHPDTLDCLAQSLAPAAARGLTKAFTKLAIPTYIDEFYVCPPPEKDIKIQTEITEQRHSGQIGDIIAVSGGQVVAEIKGFQLSAISDGEDENEEVDPHAAVELEWKEDLNLVDVSMLISQAEDRSALHSILDKFAALCMLETADRLDGVTPTRPHLVKFYDWLLDVKEGVAQGRFAGLPTKEVEEIAKLDPTARENLRQDVYKQLEHTIAAAPATAMHRITASCKGILDGTEEELGLLLENDVLHRIYDFSQNSEYAGFLDLLAHRKPTLKILEIGAGTGGTTNTILPVLKSATGERMYASYTYTDISSGFFPAAKERFKEYANVDFAILDVSKDPAEQGFALESYDLVIACNVLHATPSLKKTLANVRKLVHPRGRVFLQELSPATKWINFVMGVLPGWWLGAEDSRVSEPYVDSKRWKEELATAGFSDFTAVHDSYLNNNIVCMATPASLRAKKVTLLVPSDKPAQPIHELEAVLAKSGYEVDRHTLGSSQGLPVNQDVLCALDLVEPFFASMDETSFTDFQNVTREAKDGQCGILWVTGTSQVGKPDPRYAPVIGLARVLRTEMDLDFGVLELEDFASSGGLAVVPAVLEEFQKRIVEPDVNPEIEFAYVDGKTLISRYHFIVVGDELKTTGDEDTSVRKLEQRKPGLASTLYWKPQQPKTLGADQVRVAVKAVGVNFKDLLISLGIVAEPWAIGDGMGCECSGLITEIGDQVSGLRIGDRVAATCGGCYTTELVIPQAVCAKIPDQLSFEDAAIMMCVYCTAIYCLLDAGRLGRGMSVLIHSAAGGVGIAAVQLAKMVGAQIYCTVSNEEKINYLNTHYGIPREHIFYSRDATFLPDIMRATNGRGVDVVFNSLSGDLLHASWKCVAEFGTFVEIGRRDMIGRGKLALEQFESNRTFVGFDLTLFVAKRTHLLQSLMQRAVEYYKLGHIKPVCAKRFSATHISEPFRHLQKAEHIGKFVVTMPDDIGELPTEATHDAIRLRGDRAYLFVGGLGGLGRSITRWLIEKGATHVVFLSRSAEDFKDDDPFIQELSALGCRATRISGDVCKYEDVVRTIKSVDEPFAGVLQGSMVLRDGEFASMPWTDWLAASRPKIQGTWNLHNAFVAEQPEPLDHFFLFSSAGATCGHWGQANYNAGNTFLDCFVNYRHALGLPASSLNVGIMGDVGYVSENPDILDALRATASYISKEPELLDCIELMLKRSQPSGNPAAAARLGNQSAAAATRRVQHAQIAMGLRSALPLAAPGNRVVWRKDPRMLLYRNLESSSPQEAGGSSSSDDERLKQLVKEASANVVVLRAPETGAAIALHIGRTLLDFMMKGDGELELEAPLASMGMDSLISVELRSWIRKRVGVDVTTLEIMRAESLRVLGEVVQGKLVEKYKARA